MPHPDDGQRNTRSKRPKEVIWAERRSALISQVTGEFSDEHPHLTPRSLRVIVEKKVDLKLLYERFSHEP
jgi:hypothetical protein